MDCVRLAQFAFGGLVLAIGLLLAVDLLLVLVCRALRQSARTAGTEAHAIDPSSIAKASWAQRLSAAPSARVHVPWGDPVPGSQPSPPQPEEP